MVVDTTSRTKGQVLAQPDIHHCGFAKVINPRSDASMVFGDDDVGQRDDAAIKNPATVAGVVVRQHDIRQRGCANVVNATTVKCGVSAHSDIGHRDRAATVDSSPLDTSRIAAHSDIEHCEFAVISDSAAGPETRSVSAHRNIGQRRFPFVEDRPAVTTVPGTACKIFAQCDIRHLDDGMVVDTTSRTKGQVLAQPDIHHCGFAKVINPRSDASMVFGDDDVGQRDDAAIKNPATVAGVVVRQHDIRQRGCANVVNATTVKCGVSAHPDIGHRDRAAVEDCSSVVVGASHDRQAAEVGHCSRINQEHPTGIVAADRQQVCSWPGDCRGGHVRQFELAGGQRDLLRSGEYHRVEGDGIGPHQRIRLFHSPPQAAIAAVIQRVGYRQRGQQNAVLQRHDAWQV